MSIALETLVNCLPHVPKWEYNWTELARIAPLSGWFALMKETPQNPVWHGEGDVWTHTRLVCEALAKMADFRALPSRARDALALAALLHDIGKPTCTRLEDGALVSPRHGPVGAKLARKLLWQDFGLCGNPEAQQFREAACLLVRYHTKPVHLIEASAASRSVLKLAANGELTPGFTLRALCLLSRADALGRKAADSQDYLDRIELAEQLTLEEGCMDGPYPFRSAHTQRALLSGGSVWRDQDLFDDTWGEVILMCGLPGTGKDAWIRANHPDLPVVSLDDLRLEMGVSPTDNQWRVVQAAKERAKSLLRKKRPFIWNATSLTSLRSQQVDLFERYHARTRIVYLETDWSENLRRNAERATFVPETVIDDMLARLEPPERFEAQTVQWLCL